MTYLCNGTRVYRCLKLGYGVMNTEKKILGLQGSWFIGYGLRLT